MTELAIGLLLGYLLGRAKKHSRGGMVVKSTDNIERLKARLAETSKPDNELPTGPFNPIIKP